MKRVIALITAAALAAAFTGCHKAQPGTSATDAPGATMAVALSHSYAAKQLLSEQNFGFYKAMPFGEKILLDGWLDGKEIIALLDPDANGLSACLVLEDGGIAGMDVQEDTADVLLRYHNEDWTEQWLEHVTYDASLNELKREDVTELWGHPAEPYLWARDAQGNEYLGVIGEAILCLKADGTLQTIDGTQGNEKLFRGRDGRVYGISADNDRSIDVYDAGTLKKERIDIDLPKSGYNNAKILPGNENYDYLCYNDDDFYGVTIADGSITQLVNWEASDFNGNHIAFAYQLQDGRVIVMELTGDHSSPYTTWLMTARTQEELDSMTLISLASLRSTSDDLVHLYNRQAQGHRITLKSYYTEESWNGRKGELESDLINGVVPDILMDGDNLNYQMLSNKGLFEDLSVWMADDPEFHEDEYLMNFFESMKYKGRLERIATRFSVDAWMAKTEFLDGKTNLTMADYFALDLPEGMTLLGSAFGRHMAFEQGMYSQLGLLVDYENGTCRFDSPEFVRMMEMFMTLPEQAGVQDDYAVEENRVLLLQQSLWELREYAACVQTKFGNADVTLVGTPLEADGSGGIFQPASSHIMMLSSSAHKEEVWEFIKFCLNKENQSSISIYSYGFPVHLEALEAAFEKDQQSDDSYHYNSTSVMPATKEQADELMAYIKGTTVCAYSDETVRNIVSEEAEKYFAGDCTAEDAAKMMQSRVSLYLAEQS